MRRLWKYLAYRRVRVQMRLRPAEQEILACLAGGEASTIDLLRRLRTIFPRAVFNWSVGGLHAEIGRMAEAGRLYTRLVEGGPERGGNRQMIVMPAPEELRQLSRGLLEYLRATAREQLRRAEATTA